jgi:hypothetical protein
VLVLVPVLACVSVSACGGSPAPEIPTPVSSSGVSGARAYAVEALTGEPRHRDVARAAILLQIECDKGDLRACVERALALDLYDARPAALGEAMRRYEDVCKRATVTPCEAVAKRALVGDGHAFLERDACDGGGSVEMLACYNLADMLDRGIVTAPDAADARVLRKKACDGGLRRAC